MGGSGVDPARVAELKDRGIPIYGLSNWSAETFPPQRERFPFLSWFDDLVISGVERVIKPDPRIFRILLERNGVDHDDLVHRTEDAVLVWKRPRKRAERKAAAATRSRPMIRRVGI